MRVPGILMLLLAAGATAGAAHPGPAAPKVTDIVPIPLKPGINQVPGFLPGGGTATIVQAWHGNGNAHGYSAYMVLTGPSEGNPVGLAPFDHGDVDDIIRDDPFDGERTLGTVAFARARIDGKPASIVIDAHLDWTAGRPFADHERAKISIYRLTVEEEGIGPPLAFERIATLRTTKRYCNVALAVRDMLGVPLPAGDFAGNRTDGCL